MTELLQPAKPAKGRPPLPVVCRDIGREFDSVADAVAWLNGQGRPATAGALENALSQGTGYKGYRWKRPARPEGSGTRGPLPGAKYGPRGVPPAVACVPRTAVCCPDTGECYRDPEVAAEVLRVTGYNDVTAGRIVQAIADGVRAADRYWDWRARHLAHCGTEAETGVKCPECAARAAAFVGAGTEANHV